MFSGVSRSCWRVVGALAVSMVAGCSIHPIPDDLSHQTTRSIVLNVRCEAKVAVRERIALLLQGSGDPELARMDPETVAQRIEEIHVRDPRIAIKLAKYFASAIGYDFDFMIDEFNNKTATAGFQLPFNLPSVFSLDVEGQLKKQRTGHRTFKMVEFFEDLDLLNCADYQQPRANLLYPITGSIGMGRIMHTFIDLAEQGGGDSVFTDMITFRTELFGKVNPSVMLSPVKDSFRLVSGSFLADAKRIDNHMLTVTISFPTLDDRTPATLGVYARADVGAATKERVLEALCIAHAEDREDRAGTIRLIAPEVSCRGTDILSRSEPRF